MSGAHVEQLRRAQEAADVVGAKRRIVRCGRHSRPPGQNHPAGNRSDDPNRMI
jgi:hypothetical protein